MSARSFASMATQNLECRSVGHAWYHQTSIVGRDGFVELSFTCKRCGAQRRDIYIRKTGELSTRTYKHPNDYLVTKLKKEWGGRRVFNANVRVELIGRYVKKAKKR